MVKLLITSFLLFGSLIIVGVLSDIIYHMQISRELFVSIPHLITLSGMVGVIISVFISLKKPHRIERSKYQIILGVICLLIGGIGDAILHLMGVEEGELFSRPTHLLILLGAALILFNLPTKNKQKMDS